MRYGYRSTVAVALAAVVAALASTASASASEFVLSRVGTLTGSSLTTQVFTVPAVGKWECSTDTASGSATALRSTTLKLTVQYEGCQFFGKKMSYSPAELEFNINGNVTLLKTLTLKATGCIITMPPQTLSSVTYSNSSGGALRVATALSQLESSGAGTACSYASEKGGKLNGSSLAELLGGTIEVQ